MIYPVDFTADDIMEFEFEYNRMLDLEQNVDFVKVNQELSILSEQFYNESDMAYTKKLVAMIQDDISLSVLNFTSIAEKYNVPLSVVTDAWDDLCIQEDKALSSQYDYPDADAHYEDRLEV
jgi:hypothetical protein